MSWPRPAPGLVIRYSYLRVREFEQGREEGVKDRPCAIIIAALDLDGRTRVTVLPITHSPPADPAAAVEIPLTTKIRLALDSARSWIVLDEGNEFFWPGPNLRPLPGADVSTIAYGFLPPRLLDQISDRYLALAGQRRSRAIPRTE